MNFCVPSKMVKFCREPVLSFFSWKLTIQTLFMPFYGYLSNFGHFQWVISKKGSIFRKHLVYIYRNVKCSYSCMKNMAGIIRSHNVKVLSTTATNSIVPTHNCYCRQRLNCPLGGICLKECVVYKATVSVILDITCNKDQECH